jgi:biopolymer transport protein ExbD
MAIGFTGERDATEEEVEETVMSEINITPLTDIFLVLLIIFMVTSTALVEHEVQNRAGVRVSLPKAKAAGPLTQRKDDPILTLTQDGELFLDAKKIKIDNLENEIRDALQARKSETLLLRGDKSVLLGKAVDVMSLAKRAGARQLGIITTPTQAAPAVPKP